MDFYTLLTGLCPVNGDEFVDSRENKWLFRNGELNLVNFKTIVPIDEIVLKAVKPPTGFCKMVKREMKNECKE